MRSFFAALLTIGILSSVIAQKKIQFGIKAGMNISMISASVGSTSTPRYGFHFGGYAIRSLTKSILLRPELYYSCQGEKDEYKEMPTGITYGNTTTKLDYINLPVLVQFGNRLNFHAGLQIDFLVSAKEEGEFWGAPSHKNLKDETKPIEYSYVLGLGYEAKHIAVGARINMGVSEIFDDSDTTFNPSMTHKIMHFYIGYRF